MHVFEFEHILERALWEVVRSHFPLDWKEDALTHDLAMRLRRELHRTTLQGTRFPLEVEWEIYKLHGSLETRHGDIGLLFRQGLPDGSVIEGAGFIEAKVRHRDSRKFSQVRQAQVRRILTRSHKTHLLLYDYSPVSVLDPTSFWEPGCSFVQSWSCSDLTHALVTYGPVLPLDLAAEIRRYDDSLYRYCHSFSHQFVRRYFQLHDLDFSPDAIEAVKGFPGRLGSPNVLMIVRTAPAGQELPESIRPNENLYEEIGGP